MNRLYIVGILILILIFLGVGTLFFSSPSVNKESGNSFPYIEIKNPAGFVNTGDQPIKIGDFVGQKVIMLDVMTYSCINCQRTFPYVTAWYEKYKDEGLIVIGIHTPEFAFEKDKNNVVEAMKKFGITFPVVLDNDYGTWNAYGNRYWPRKYLIDIHGNVVYDHIGEGAYEETEMKIKELLSERNKVLGVNDFREDTLVSTKIDEVKTFASSPETYFGYLRNEFLGNGIRGQGGEQNFILPTKFKVNTLYLGGQWNITDEQAISGAESEIIYRYNAKEVYLVASSLSEVDIEVWQDGKLVDANIRGSDVDSSGVMTVKNSQLYKVIKNQNSGEHILRLKIKGGVVNAFAFTFG